MSTSTVTFYVTGGTLQRDAACYVERQADSALFDGLKEGRFCYVLTSRQMGKSSLMVRTAMRLRQHAVTVVVLDLTAIGQNLTAEQWYSGLINQIGQRLEMEDEMEGFWFKHRHLGPLQCWMRAIREVVLPNSAGQIVIFIDEIDTVRSLPFSTDEFFAGIREFYNQRTEDAELKRLTFCLLGVATSSELIRDTRTTPFNIGQRIELKDFTEAEAASLAIGLGREEEIGRTLLRRVLYWTGGHPYLTQRLCRAIAEDEKVKDGAGVDRLCEEIFRSHRAQERDDNLLFVRERILRSEVDIAGLLDLYRRVHRGRRVRDDETSRLVNILRLSGIVRVENGCLKIRNRIYERVFDEEWIKTNMPDAELRRQREAFRRGLLGATSVALLIIAVIAGLAIIALNQRKQANLKAEEALLASQEAEKQRQVAEKNAEFAKKNAEEAEHQSELAGSSAQQAKQALSLAEENALQTKRQLLKLYEETGRQELLDGKADRALVYLGEAYQGGSDSPALRFLIAQSIRQLNGLKPLSLEGHTNWVRSAAFSPDGKHIVTAGADKTAKIWDAVSGRLLLTLQGHAESVNSATFSPDGKRIATASHDQTARVWDALSGRLLFTIEGHKGSVNSAVFSPDGKYLLTAGLDRSARLWDSSSGKLLVSLEGHKGNIHSAMFSPDGRRIVTASLDRTAKIWDIASGKLLASLDGHKGSVNAASFSPDGERIVTASSDNTVKVWDSASRKALISLEAHASFVHSAAFSPDGKRIVTASSDRTAKIWDAASGKLLASLPQNESIIRSAVFDPSGARIVTAGYDQTAKVWDAKPETRRPKEISEIVSARVPLRLVGERLEPVRPQAKEAAVQPENSASALSAQPSHNRTYDFDIVSINEAGRIMERHNGQAQYFTEDLGSRVTLDMVPIPGGTFLMGSPPNEEDREKGAEDPQHTVVVQPFYMGKFEVTQAQWKAIMGSNPSRFKGDDLPVENVNWYDVMEFCERLSERTGNIYRLPTEAEWEYACRGGTVTPFHFGETITPVIANYNGRYPYGTGPKGIYREKTTPVGSFGVANQFGLYDMHGNVFEWCLDWYHEGYREAPIDGRAWESPAGRNRVLRGGSWVSFGNLCRSTNRFRLAPDTRYAYVGFRVVTSSR